MARTVRVLVSALLGRHPAPEILQACADRELNDLANAVTRSHVRRCEACQDEMRSSAELLGLFVAGDSEPVEVSLVRDRILTALAEASAPPQLMTDDVRRLLGRRAAERMADGTALPELRVELAAFLGSRAADSFLHRLPG